MQSVYSAVRAKSVQFRLNSIPPMLRTLFHVLCAYQKDKLAKPENVVNNKALLECGERWIEKYLYLLRLQRVKRGGNCVCLTTMNFACAMYFIIVVSSFPVRKNNRGFKVKTELRPVSRG
jgi:hypothetical protein